MGRIRDPQSVKLIIGFIFRNEIYLKQAIDMLKRRFGRVDFISDRLAFEYTDYYRKEFGRELKRSFISFEELIDPGEITEIKHFSNQIEKKLSHGFRRRINIDPGYLDLSKFVLTTTKDYAHRIYLNHGIFAEITLSYQKTSFCGGPWTYPDYKSPAYIAIFNKIRGIFYKQIH